jgi:iron complex outermembrane receptor protein
MQAFAATPAPAATGTELEEVIVTAERRTVDIQSVPASVTVRTGEELTAQGRTTTRQILEDIPGIVAVDNSTVNIGSADVQGNNITIRGIASGASRPVGGPAGISSAPGAAVYVDGVYEGIGSGYDIERVEVLRGPQGTLYGRSATTGVVAFHTRDPSTDAFGGNAGVEFGNYDLQHYTAAVNIPLTNGLAVRVSGDYHDQGKGYYGEAGGGGMGGNGLLGKQTNGRAKLLWKPNDDFSLLVGFAYAKNDDFSGGNSYVAAVPTRALTTRISPIFPSYKQQRQYWAEANWDIGPFKVTYLPAFRTWEQSDHLVVDPSFISSGSPLNQTLITPKDNFLTHELRVASKEGSAVQWQAGAFYYRNTLTKLNHDYLVTPSGAEGAVLSDTSDQKDTLDKGLFAEATIPLGASVRTTLGARYDDTNILISEFFYNDIYATCGTAAQFATVLPPGATCTGVGTASVPSPPGASLNNVVLKFYNFNYKVRLEYDLTPKNMLYGMLSTGFRPGDEGINNGAPNILDAEKLTSIEVGSKNRFLDDSLQLNVGVYHYNYHGFQTSYVPDTANPLDPARLGTSVNVTVPAHNIGGELELLYRLTMNDRIGFNYNYVRSSWYDKPAGFAAAQTEDKRALTPYTMTANYEHVFPLPGGSTLSARIDGRYEAAHLGSNLHIDWLRLGYDQYVYVNSRTIGNLSAGWASNGGRYSISAYVRNFTDKQYIAYGVGSDPTTLNVSRSDPRTYGARASVSF